MGSTSAIALSSLLEDAKLYMVQRWEVTLSAHFGEGKCVEVVVGSAGLVRTEQWQRCSTSSVGETRGPRVPNIVLVASNVG
jgi:hypothetical protein